VARAAIFVGSIFPDIDVFANPFEPNGLGTVRWHRGVTHSLVCMPVFALLLGALIGGFCRWRRIERPAWLRLSAACGAGIALHIVFDLITSFGTMAWSPLDWTRVSWDTTFIIDPVLTAILALPLLLMWIYRRREKAEWRGVFVWIGLSVLALGVTSILRAVEQSAAASQAVDFGAAQVRLTALWIAGAASALLACVLGFPAARGKGFGVSRRGWCSAGAAVTAAYLIASAGAHAMALRRVEDFASAQGLRVEGIGALPMPPSLLFWSGLVSTPGKIYYSYFELSSGEAPKFREYEQSPQDACVRTALESPNVQTVLRFARFPLIVHHHREGASTEEVEFQDLRFLPQRGGVISFTYQVFIDAASGRIREQGWRPGQR
jgi:membrane-bound metal-dependent hydrolase YbcI (DUF457 family)